MSRVRNRTHHLDRDPVLAGSTLGFADVHRYAAEPLSGTEERRPIVPYFSPDERWVGFYSIRDRELQKVAITGGSAVSLCAAPMSPRGASWSDNDTIVYEQARALFRVPAAGGTPKLLVSLEEGERAHAPQLLPGGQALLFTLGRNDWDEAQ